MGLAGPPLPALDRSGRSGAASCRARPGIDFGMQGLVGRSADRQECSLEGCHGMPDPEVVEQPLHSVRFCCRPQHCGHFFVGACDLARDFIGEAATQRSEGLNEHDSGTQRGACIWILQNTLCPGMPHAAVQDLVTGLELLSRQWARGSAGKEGPPRYQILGRVHLGKFAKELPQNS